MLQQIIRAQKHTTYLGIVMRLLDNVILLVLLFSLEFGYSKWAALSSQGFLHRVKAIFYLYNMQATNKMSCYVFAITA